MTRIAMKLRISMRAIQNPCQRTSSVIVEVLSFSGVAFSVIVPTGDWSIRRAEKRLPGMGLVTPVGIFWLRARAVGDALWRVPAAWSGSAHRFSLKTLQAPRDVRRYGPE